MSIKLEAKIRANAGRGLNQLRQAGVVPGVVYGHGIENINVMVNRGALVKVFKAAGENTLVELEVAGDKTRHVIINEVQTDPIKGFLDHVDFLEVRLDQKVKAEVPLEFVGESPAVKELNGTLVKNIQHVEVEALPQKLPHALKVDISLLKKFENRFLVSDIKVEPEVKILTEPEQVVASVMPPRSEEELEAIKGEVVEDISKVEGVVKEETPAEGETKAEIKSGEKQ